MFITLNLVDMNKFKADNIDTQNEGNVKEHDPDDMSHHLTPRGGGKEKSVS